MKSPCLVIFSIALLFASASCKRSKDGVVLIDPDKAVPAVLEDVACDIKVIPLKSDRPIPGFTFLYFYDDYFFSTDLNYDEYNFTRVGVFDRQGNYIGTIDRQGRGRNEYLRLANFVYHADSQQLHLYDDPIHSANSQPTIFKFQLPQLEFLGTQYPGLIGRVSQIVHLGDGNSLSSLYADEGLNDMAIVKCLPDTVLILKEYGTFGINRISSTFYHCHFTNKYNPLIAMFGYENSIYSLDSSDSLKLEFSFSFGPKGLPKSYADNQSKLGPYISRMDDERDQYMEEGLDILYGAPVKNGNLISFMYFLYTYHEEQFFRHFYVTNGRKSADYSKLTIPGLEFNIIPRLVGINGTSYVFCLEGVRVDPSAPLSPLGQQILDAVRSQNDDNPILLQFRFKDL